MLATRPKYRLFLSALCDSVDLATMAEEGEAVGRAPRPSPFHAGELAHII